MVTVVSAVLGLAALGTGPLLREPAAGLASGPVVTVAPLPPSADAQFPAPQLRDVDCPSAGVCLAVGSFDRPGNDRRALVVSLRGTGWTASELPLPRDAGKSPGSTLSGISCAGPSLCAAVGTYHAGKSARLRPLVAVWDGDRWRTSSPRLPADAARLTIDPLIAVACGGPGSCVAVGSYPARDGRVRPLMTTLRSGHWSSVAGTLPPGQDNGELWAVDCASGRSCVAVGASEVVPDRSSAAAPQQALAQVLSGRAWRAEALPLPRDAKERSFGILEGVSCPSATRCTAVGGYQRRTPRGNRRAGLVVTQTASGWDAGRVRPPRGSGSEDASLSDVVCRSNRTCVAIGRHSTVNTGFLLPMVAGLAGATGKAIPFTLPTDAARPEGLLGDLVCTRSACVSVGSTRAGGGDTVPLLVTVHGGQVSASVPAFPEDAGGTLTAVALASGGTAVAAGSASSPVAREVLVTGISVTGS